MNEMPRLRPFIACVLFALLLYGFWTQVQAFGLAKSLGTHIGSAFTCFALLLAVLWFFGFGIHKGLQSAGTGFQARPLLQATKVLLPVTLALPYLFFSIPRHEFQFIYFAGLALLPVACSALIEFTQPEQKFTWQDFVILFGIALILELRLFSGAWPYPGLGSLPKLYLADVVLYVYLVVRQLDRVGYSYVPQLNDFLVGIREWAFFLPFALALGFATHFIRFIPRHPSASMIVGALLITFLLTAIPEELFFRGILQNLLEPRLGRNAALVLTACLFGLSHFHKGATFNWRYVMLATIAGIFYGRAWRSRRHLFASALTHTLVDVVWSLWFR
jgi:membrane protease YdiL (CAAX protease family)